MLDPPRTRVLRCSSSSAIKNVVFSQVFSSHSFLQPATAIPDPSKKRFLQCSSPSAIKNVVFSQVFSAHSFLQPSTAILDPSRTRFELLQSTFFTMFQPLGHQKRCVFRNFQGHSFLQPSTAILDPSRTCFYDVPTPRPSKTSCFPNFQRSPIPPSIDSSSTAAVWAQPTRISNARRAISPLLNTQTQACDKNPAKEAKSSGQQIHLERRQVRRVRNTLPKSRLNKVGCARTTHLSLQREARQHHPIL